MSKYPFRVVKSTVTKVTNATFLEEVAKLAPQFKQIAARDSANIFTEAGFEAMSQLPTGHDNVSDFYSVALMVGLQFVDYAKFNSKADEIGVLERFALPLAEYIQRNRIGRIQNVNPAWKGLKDGDSVDPYIVKKPEVIQDFYGGKNEAYQAIITFQEFDLKRGWLTEGGIGEIVGAIYNMVDLNRAEYEYGLVMNGLHAALSSETHPMQGTQKIALVTPDSAPANYTADTFTKAELIDLVENTLNIGEAFEASVSLTTFNSAKYPSKADTKDLVMLVRTGYKAKIRTMLADVYHDENLKIPFDMKVVENFGGLVPYDSDNAKLTPIYSKLGEMVGYITEAAAAEHPNAYAVYNEANDTWGVVDGATSLGPVVAVNAVDHYVDPHEKTVAVIVEKGLLFELIQNPFNVRSIFNPRGEYTNTFFNQLDNFMGYNYTKTLIEIDRVDAQGRSAGKNSSKG